MMIVMSDGLDGDQDGLAGFDLGLDLGFGEGDSAWPLRVGRSRRSRITLTSGST